MARPGPDNDEERLPWLEPYRDTPPAAPAPVPARKRGAGLVVSGIAALAAALTAGYYIGQRDPRPEAPPVEVALAPPVAPPAAPAPVVPAPIVPMPVATAPPPATAEQAPVRKAAKATRKQPARTAAAQRRIRNAGIENARLRQVRAAQERPAAPRPTAYRPWPKMPSPGPAGQVIQLGAFKNPSGANRAYRSRLARYPMLGSMPRVVVPVITRPRGRILYVLRLGTTSRQQSGIVCRNLRASGDHCLVIG